MLYVYKSMLNKLQNDQRITGWRGPIIFYLLITMMIGLFVSRAALSISMIAFLIVACIHNEPARQIRLFFATPMLWGMSLLFFLPLISGFWSSNKEEWEGIMRIKIPLLALPFAFAAPMSLTNKQWRILALVFISIVTLASFWCIWHYIPTMPDINESYLRGKSMLTPLENDHVRFSWLVAVAVLFAILYSWSLRTKKDWRFWCLVSMVVWLIFFLHILAARTGLLSLYIILGVLAIATLFTGNRKITLIALASLIALPIAAYFLLPSFRNRVRYIRYDFSYFKNASYLPGATDAVRVISINTGLELMNDDPIAGVGFGDIGDSMRKKYERLYPGILEQDKILPSSEWLMYGAGAGWPGFILFSGIMIIPFFSNVKRLLPWIILNMIAAFSFLFDIGLEVQFGVFIYAFIVLSFWKWSRG